MEAPACVRRVLSLLSLPAAATPRHTLSLPLSLSYLLLPGINHVLGAHGPAQAVARGGGFSA